MDGRTYEPVSRVEPERHEALLEVVGREYDGRVYVGREDVDDGRDTDGAGREIDGRLGALRVVPLER